jgi:N-acetylneuraminic acid mutarotase
VLITSFSVSSASIDTSPTSCWSTAERLPTARIEMAGAMAADKIYIIGGYTDESTDIVEAYDSLQDEWSVLASLPEKLDHLAAATYNDKIYVVGGFKENGSPSSRLFIYDISSDEWKEGSEMPTPRGALTAEFVDGILYAIGGDKDDAIQNDKYNPSGETDTNEAYDPETDSWSQKQPMPTPRHHHVSAVVAGNLFVIGGRYGLENSDHKFNNSNANEVYDPKQNAWVSLAPTPTNRSGAAAVAVNESIYVLGGETNNYPTESQGTYNKNEKYDTVRNTWTSEPPMSVPRHGLSAEAVDNKIYVIGGGREPGSSTDDINEIFDISRANDCMTDIEQIA